MRPSKIAAAGMAGLGAERIGGAGHAQHRSRHRIEHAAAMRVGDRNPVRIDRRLRIDAVFLDGAVHQHHVDGFGFLRGRGRGLVIGRHQRAIDDAALRRAGAGAAGEGLQQPRGAAGRGGRKLIVRDLDGPAALADRNARQRRLVMRLELALRGRRTPKTPTGPETVRKTAKTPAHRRPSTRGNERASRGDIMPWVFTSGRSLHPRGVTSGASFKPKYPSNNG